MSKSKSKKEITVIKTVWKYNLTYGRMWKATLPKGSEILDIVVHNDKPYIWVLLNIEAKEDTEERIFEMFFTGSEIKYDKGIIRKHIKTFIIKDTVYHVFERFNNEEVK